MPDGTLEETVRDAIDRLTAAVLTLAMETLRAQSGHTSGEVSDTVRAKVFDAYNSTLGDLWK
jgi:hypothetical protein